MKIEFPKFSFDKLKDFLAEFSSRFNKKDLKSSEINTKLIIKPDHNSLPEKKLFITKMIKFVESDTFNLKIRSRPKINKNWISCSKDTNSKKWYYFEGFESVQIMNEYQNIDDLFSNTNPKNIEIDIGIDGTYSFVQNGYLFHSVSCSTNIGKSSLSTGSLVEEFNLGSVKYRNGGAQFNWDGCTDICLFNDEFTNIQYIMYEFKDKNTTSISEITCFPKFKLGKYWKIPIKKSSIGFAFINNYIVYIGLNCKLPIISKIFNLIEGSFKDVYDLRFKFNSNEDYITFTTFIPSENLFIVCGKNNIERCSAFC